MKILSKAIIVAVNLCAVAWAQSGKPASLPELAAYTGADREQLLVAGARRESKVVWYTSLAGSSYKEIARAFEAKYPGVKVDVYRGTSQDLMSRIMAEAQARRYLVDTVESTLPLLKAMRDSRLLALFNSPYLANYPDDAKEKADKGLFFWAVDRESYIGVAFNRNVIPANAVPKGYEDLLRPEFKGKLGFATSDTGPRSIAAMLTFKGEEFLKRLRRQEVALYTLSARALVDLVASGEVGASPTIFRSHASEVAEKGAPVSWVPMEVVPTNAGGVVVATRAPHPHAAVLLVDFILGSEAQRILEKLEYGNATKDYGFKRWYPEQGLTTEQYERENNRWDKLLRELGRK